MEHFPRPYTSPRQLMPADALIRLNEVTNELLQLARASRANKVRMHAFAIVHQWPAALEGLWQALMSCVQACSGLKHLMAVNTRTSLKDVQAIAAYHVLPGCDAIFATSPPGPGVQAPAPARRWT